MTIDKLGGNGTPPVRGGPPVARVQSGADPAATSRAGGSAPATDAVSLTPQSRQLREVESKLSETPAFDSARVAELRKAIERGEYRVDSRRVAGKLLEFERDLSAPGAGD